MKNKGFTLIELLAVIIILGLIAVITIPKITEQVEDSKKNLAKTAAYSYKKAVNEYTVAQQLNKNIIDLNGTYGINENGYLYKENSTIEIKIDGEKPKNGYLTYVNDDLKTGCITMNKYKVSFQDGEVSSIEKGECEEYVEFNGKYVAATQSDTHKGIVYLDPTDLSKKCDETNYITTPGTKTGCMKFYIFDNSDNKNFNMILDHNTSFKKQWTLYKENDQYVNYKGPREALYQLYEDTKNWNGIPSLSATSNYTINWTYDDVKTSYTIDYTKHLSRAGAENSYTYTIINGAHKARFITAEEVATIVEKENWTINNEYLFYLISKDETNQPTDSNPSDYAWLYENLNNCETYGCKKQSSLIEGNYGYWTSSSATKFRRQVWYIDGYGYLNRTAADWPEPGTSTTGGIGIRPVISLPKYIIEL